MHAIALLAVFAVSLPFVPDGTSGTPALHNGGSGGGTAFELSNGGSSGGSAFASHNGGSGAGTAFGPPNGANGGGSSPLRSAGIERP